MVLNDTTYGKHDLWMFTMASTLFSFFWEMWQTNQWRDVRNTGIILAIGLWPSPCYGKTGWAQAVDDHGLNNWSPIASQDKTSPLLSPCPNGLWGPYRLLPNQYLGVFAFEGGSGGRGGGGVVKCEVDHYLPYSREIKWPPHIFIN